MSSPSASAGAAELKAGLAALKQENYDEAIALLRRVPQGKRFESAQRALVVAYDRIEKFETAIALCYALANSPDAAVQGWAKKSLKKLKQRARLKEVQTAEAPTVAFAPPPEKPKSTLAKRNPRWRSLGPIPVTRWHRLALVGLASGGLWQWARAPFWPNWLEGYVWAIVLTLGLVLASLVFINARRLSRRWAPVNLRVEEALVALLMAWFLPASLYGLIVLGYGGLNRIPSVSLAVPYRLTGLWFFQVAAFLLLVMLPWGGTALIWLYRFGQSGPQRSIGKDIKRAILQRIPGPLQKFKGLSPEQGEELSASSSQPDRFWQVLPLSTLGSYSADAAALMRRFFRQQRQQDPALVLLLATETPLILSFGSLSFGGFTLGGAWRPRLIVSRGFLEQLDSEAIAALIAAELGHFENHSSLIFPWLVSLLQLPYGLYRGFAAVGNHCQEKLQQRLDIGFKLLFRLGFVVSGILAAIAYGLYKLWRLPLLGLSRSRSRYGDRATTDFLGDPNAYSRALVAYAQALNQTIQRQEKTPGILESFELLLPLGLPIALTTCLAESSLPLGDRLTWDCQTPYRFWLNLNNAHPLLGERLSLLNHYGQRSGLNPEFELPPTRSDSLSLVKAYFQSQTLSDRRQAVLQALTLWPPLLRQGAPFYGGVAGLLLGLLLWGIGAITSLFGLSLLDGIFGDRTLLLGLMPIGLSLGLILRTNSFFPQRQQRETATAAAAQLLLPDPARLPVNAEPVKLSGKLIGRPAVANWLGQDLLLQTEAGPLRLHWCSPLGPAGNLWPKFLRPSFLLDREVIVTGWLRRGATLWLDVEQLQTQSGGRSSQRGHPVWAAVMAAIAAIVGCLILLRF